MKSFAGVPVDVMSLTDDGPAGDRAWGVYDISSDVVLSAKRVGALLYASVNADVEQLDVILVPEEDTRVNPLGVKGIGEIGIVGMNAAVANAVFHATGKRIRDLPIRIENLL